MFVLQEFTAEDAKNAEYFIIKKLRALGGLGGKTIFLQYAHELI
jgi:hypothetical protein